MNKDLGIVICNFNKVDYLKGCLQTLYKSNFENLSYDVIVVDNASTDESVYFVKDNFKEIILLENEVNTGGSGGFDRGIRYCQEKSYEYVVLLDNDILLEENTIINLVNYIKSNPNVGIVGSKICTMDNPDILQELGSFIDFEDKFDVKTPLKGHKDDDSLPEIVNCDYVPACCLITTKKVLKKVGSFNTDHFIYWDDMDWCTRVKKAGFEVHAINRSRVFHKMGAANHTNTFGVYYFERNRIMFFLKYLHENKIEAFVDSICKWLLSVTFFSSLKGNYATPKSLLFAIDDLFSNNMGRQDDSIFIKEQQVNIFEKYDLTKEDKVCLYLSDDMITNRRIYLFLKDFYDENINIYCKKENEKLIKQNFDEDKIISEEKFVNKGFDRIFFAMEHILDFDEGTLTGKNYIYIDQFVNTVSYKDVYNLKASYEMHHNMFKNIYQPVIERKFKIIRNNLIKDV